MIAVNVKQRRWYHGDEIAQIRGLQVAAGKDDIRPAKDLGVKVIPDELALKVRNSEYFNFSPPPFVGHTKPITFIIIQFCPFRKSLLPLWPVAVNTAIKT